MYYYIHHLYYMYLLYIFKYIQIKILFDKFVFFKSEFTLFYRWQSQHLSVSYPHLDIKENICDPKKLYASLLAGFKSTFFLLQQPC